MTLRFAFVVVLFALQCPALAEPLSHGRSLDGLDRVRAVFDVNQGDPEILLLRMTLIDRTAKQVREAGKALDFAVVFRGRASRYVTRGDGYVEPWDLEEKSAIRNLVESFHARGFIIEQCAIAAEAQAIGAGEFLPQVRVVPNGYLSLIGYQNQGYGLVPME
jgi:intracellular sulfur oxidation DsrE/DsrF family protein